MQSKASRAALIGAALVVAVVAFVVLRPSGDEGEGGSATTTEETTDGGGPNNGGGKAQDRASSGESETTAIEVKSGKPVDGVADISVEKGDPVSFLVRADAADHVHVHGYDEFADVAPGNPAKLEFPAELEGIFEVELEDSHVQIARLEVSP
jgi:hypothetical protein